MKFRLLDFHVFDQKDEEEDRNGKILYNNYFVIQMFGITADGYSISVSVEDYKPHFYVKINRSNFDADYFMRQLEKAMGYNQSRWIHRENCKTVYRKILYGFDNNTLHPFFYLEFHTISSFNGAKNLWYSPQTKRLLPNGFQETTLYESHIPPLLRFFHENDISPSGWVEIDYKDLSEVEDKKTSCEKEFIVNQCKNIVSLKGCDDLARYKICSFDIEASSSHGDFPVPVKTYKKLAYDIVDCLIKRNVTMIEDVLPLLIKTAFGFSTEYGQDINLVYVKTPIALKTLEKTILKLLSHKITGGIKNSLKTIEQYFENLEESDEESDEDTSKKADKTKPDKINPDQTSYYSILSILQDPKTTRDVKVQSLTNCLDDLFPPLKGDEVTFIGSTFLRFGDKEPYLNHCIVLGSCTDPHSSNTRFEMYSTEKEVLLAWTNIIQQENPDIIIGYNIFGFDYKFLFYRAKQNDCLPSFVKLSRNLEEVCGERYDGTIQMEETTTVLASGEHELHYIKITGRVQIDLYNYFRREETLPSYKLDYVAGYFIGGWIDHLDMDGSNVIVYSSKLNGLMVGSFIHFEIIGHTKEYLNNGQKFQVVQICEQECYFVVNGVSLEMPKGKLRWCLAKDDVSPQDIFRMTKESDDARYIIAKYCLQDCNLLHYLLNKVDIMTGFIEMSSICSVPISFLVFRGQGIKLTSYVAKKCREMNTLMVVLDKVESDDGYEGATVLEPKCNLYLDTPVACVDYASLYPSSMISENLSHDSKVWTREYNLEGELLAFHGNEQYDNLPGYEYVNIQYDTYKYITKKTSGKEKVKSGYKICRFAQYPHGKKAIMPMILQELLRARKTTRNLIKTEKDEFMRNVLDKRQLGYKVTANSLYGQCGAKTSSFFDKDIAASTTATGRSLLIYAKTLIETIYQNRVCQTSLWGDVLTNAEYIYGDTDSVFFTFHLKTLDNKPITGDQALQITIELAQEAGHLASSFLKSPHDLEYEKTFMPFCLLSKKRYVGILYETDITKGKRKEMGIVLKRRDNAPIVKDVYGGIIDILMKEKDIMKAVDFLKFHLQQLVEEECPMEKLIITKSLRSDYKNPQQIAHKVLADRITARDPGNKPSSGDRIPFVYFSNSKRTNLQGERIETPTFARENGLKIDYSFYITNQIMKPVQQLFSLVLEQLWKSSKKHAKLKKFEMEIKKLSKKEIEQLRNKEVKELLFDPYLRVSESKRQSQKMITQHFIKKA
jgi:DNA polymerase elongation subunit (family B)